MTGRAAGEPAAGGWPVAAAVLMVVMAGAAARIPGASPEEPGFAPAALSGIGPGQAGELVSRARHLLATARETHGPASMHAADAIDAFVRGVAATGRAAEYEEAERLAAESVRIREEACGEDCAALADSLEIYETLLWRLEDYWGARSLAERALAIRTRVSGPRGGKVAGNLYLLAEAERALGNYAAAEDLHRKAISIWAASPGGGHTRDIANSLHYLGMVRWALGDFPRARDLIEQALALREGSGAGEMDRVAADSTTLGGLAEIMGDRVGAMDLFERGRALWERSLGRDHPHVARALANQGRLLAASGDHAAAEDHFRRALEIRLRSFGPHHYLVGRSLADLGRLAFRAGDDAGAERFLRRAVEIQRGDPRAGAAELASTLIEEAKLALATGMRRRAADLALEAEALARDRFLRTSRGLGEVDALRYKAVRGPGLDVALTALGSGASSEGGVPPGDAARLWDEVIRSRAMVLDGMTARARPSAAEPRARPGLEEVARSLSDTGALVGFVKYGKLESRREFSTPSYAAFVLHPGGAPALILMGDVAGIEAAIRDWRQEVEADPRLAHPREADRRYQEAGRRLRRAIWDPLVPALRGSESVFMVPDGAVNLVSFAALPVDDGRYLIETGPAIHYLSAERDLASPHRPAPPGSGVLVVGDPEFDALPAPDSAPAERFAGAGPSCGFFHGLRFEPLPGSRSEVEEVASLWRGKGEVVELTGPAAREEAFRKLAPGRKILHLATHGYFLGDRCPSSLGGPLPPEGGVAVGENPLRLSGLALAGANRRERAPAGGDDGILTAEEIGALHLSGTEWAVLSGCETGLGQVLDGEGVVGLRRAFEGAGVATLILALWPVDDGAARVWMHHLYEGRLAGLGTVEAVSRAGLRMIESERESGRSAHPYFWGAFVAAGDWK